MPTEGGQEGLPGSVPQEQMSAERTPDQNLSVSRQEGITQPQTENVGLLTRSVRGFINILKDMASGRAHKTLNPTSPPSNVAPTEEPPSPNTPTSQPSQS